MAIDNQSTSSIDIVSTYNALLREDPDLTMPVAAIEALVHALSRTPASTVSETLDLLSKLTAELKAAIPNPIGLSAGTDLFQRYIVTTLQRPNTLRGGRAGSNNDFDSIRAHLVQNGRLFVERAKEARETIARSGRRFIRDGHTVLTNGGSRVVGALLRSAAEGSGGFGGEGSSIRFKVIYVVNSPRPNRTTGKSGAGMAKSTVEDALDTESEENISALRRAGVPVATIPPTAVAYCMSQVTACFVGAEGVVENGGIISRLGTYQLGLLAKASRKPFYVVAESHKFVRLYPLGQMDLGIEQNIVEFKTEESSSKEGGQGKTGEGGQDGQAKGLNHIVNDDPANAVDFTPPHLISGIITEAGVMLPSAVSEELIKIWF